MPVPIDDIIFVNPGDTAVVKLNEFMLLPKRKFKSKKDIRYYFWFKSKVFKVYPFAKLASQRLDTLNTRLSKIKSKRKKKNVPTEVVAASAPVEPIESIISSKK